MGNICEPYCSCNCNCENQKCMKDCAEGCGNCLSCEGCHQCTECDPRLMNPCLIRETSNKELMIILKEFDFKGENDDRWYGEVQILEHKVSKELVIMKIVESSSEQEAEQVHQSFVRRMKLTNENLVRLRCKFSKDTFLFFDYILIDLASELKHRNKKGLHFSEEEIWNLAYCLINAMKYFSSVNLQHGCLRSKNVYITQYGEFKIADPGLFNYEVSYDIIYNNRESAAKGVILSPAQVHGLERNIENPIHDHQKSDVFCVGMIILEAATLQSVDSCFDYYHAWVLEDKIADRLNDIKLKYHDSLYYMVKEMLTINELQRPDIASLFEKNQRNARFRPMNSNKYQAQAQFQVQNMDQSESLSALNNSYLTQKPNQQGGVPQTVAPVLGNTNFQKSNVYQPNMIVSRPFDNVSIMDNNFDNQDAPNFGNNDLGGFGSVVNNQYNISSNHNLLGQYSMPPPIMGTSSFGNLNFMSNNNYTSGLGLGMDFTSTNLTGTKAGREKVYETYKNGSKYEGEVRNGQRDGKGKYYYNNGGYYEGSWKEGKMNGQGTLFFPDGTTAYDGNWRDDQFHGYGTLYNNTVQPHSAPLDYKNLSNIGERWLKFEGDFKHDQKEGFGTLFFSNGERYVGGFKADKVHGQGTYYTQQNQIIKGRWANNCMS